MNPITSTLSAVLPKLAENAPLASDAVKTVFSFNTVFTFGIFGILSLNTFDNNNLAAAFLVIGAAICLISGYLLGSFNPAIYFSKKLYGGDIRNEGSGNAGMTNMLRTHGKKAGIMTALCDLGKAILSCLIGYLILGYNGAALAGFAAFLGHIAPVFYKFKGGKGVMVACGTILCLDPVIFLICMAIFGLIFYISKTVSIASITTALVYPFIFQRLSVFGPSTASGLREGIPVVCAILTMCLIVFMHRKNIKRIFEGTEPKTSVGGKKNGSVPSSEAPTEDVAGEHEVPEENEEKKVSEPNPNTSKKKAKKRK